MTTFLLIFALFGLLASSTTTEPSPTNGTSPGSTLEPIGNTTDPSPLANSTVEPDQGSLNGATNGTEPVPGPDLVPVVREIAPGSGPDRANLSKCLDPYVDCRVGNTCFDPYSHPWTTHTSLFILSHAILEKASSTAKTKMLGCTVGLVLSEDPAKVNTYHLEYHTTSAFNKIPFIIVKHGTIRRIAVKNGTLVCKPACKISNQARTTTGKEGHGQFWTATVVFNHVANRTQIDHCFKNGKTKKFIYCFVGDGCIMGHIDAKHEDMVLLDNKRLSTLSAYRRGTLKRCNVIATLRWMKYLRKHNGTNQRGYLIEFHTTPDNTNHEFGNTFKNSGLSTLISIVGGKSSEPKLHCEKNCEYVGAPVVFDSHRKTMFWSGKIIVEEPSVKGEAVIPIKGQPQQHKDDDEDERIQKNIEGQPQLKDEDEPIQKKAEYSSNIGMIFLGCAGGLVVFVVAAIVIVKVAQHRRDAKNKRRLAAINAVVRQPSNNGPGGKAAAKEVVPLIEPPPSLVEPSDELVSESAKQPDSEKTSGRQMSEMTAKGDKEE